MWLHIPNQYFQGGLKSGAVSIYYAVCNVYRFHANALKTPVIWVGNITTQNLSYRDCEWTIIIFRRLLDSFKNSVISSVSE